MTLETKRLFAEASVHARNRAERDQATMQVWTGERYGELCVFVRSADEGKPVMPYTETEPVLIETVEPFPAKTV